MLYHSILNFIYCVQYCSYTLIISTMPGLRRVQGNAMQSKSFVFSMIQFTPERESSAKTKWRNCFAPFCIALLCTLGLFFICWIFPFLYPLTNKTLDLHKRDSNSKFRWFQLDMIKAKEMQAEKTFAAIATSATYTG